MGLWDLIKNRGRYLDLYGAYTALRKNWRNPDMLSKWTQREFYLPVVYAIFRMVNDGFELGMSEETLNWAAVAVIAAVFSIAAPKIAKALKVG